MVEKVKVSQSVADAITSLLVKEYPAAIVTNHAHGWGATDARLKGIKVDTLIRALYIGYEVEQTPEDGVRVLYNAAMRAESDMNAKGNLAETQFYRGKMSAIPQVLDVLGIKIEGVND